MAEDTKEALISPIKIMQNDNMMSVVKTPGGVRLINDARLAIVNPDKCRENENPPSTFAVHGDWLISYNARWQSEYASRVLPTSRSLRS